MPTRKIRTKQSPTGRATRYPLTSSEDIEVLSAGPADPSYIDGVQVQRYRKHSFKITGITKDGRELIIRLRANNTRDAIAQFTSKFPLAVVKKVNCEDCIGLRSIGRTALRAHGALGRLEV